MKRTSKQMKEFVEKTLTNIPENTETAISVSILAKKVGCTRNTVIKWLEIIEYIQNHQIKIKVSVVKPELRSFIQVRRLHFREILESNLSILRR